jgi:hypothetical protein
LWAEKHFQIEKTISPYEQYLLDQGKAIGKLGKKFLYNQLISANPDWELEEEMTFSDSHFLARVDILVSDTNRNLHNIYEIKSSTSVKKEHKYDLAFQKLICEATIPIQKVFIVHINREYYKNGEVDINQLFTTTDLTGEVEILIDEVSFRRENAWETANQPSPEGIAGCLNPKKCPCPNLCHPILPVYSIYDLPRMHHTKKRMLKEQGTLSIVDLPDGYPLTERQTLQVEVVKHNEPIIDIPSIKAQFEQFQHPLYFLDYETFNPAVPLFDKYKPYQHIVFQYSLHVLRKSGSELEHYEYLDIFAGDPGVRLVKNLSQHIGPQGSIVVWNKTFEAARNQEMADLYPEHQQFLLDLNERIFDLMEPFSKGYYIHPDFHGSASLKDVLPILVDDNHLTYANLPISNGEEAMLAWVDLISGQVPLNEIERISADLLHYCRLDTLSMVRIWEVLEKATNEVWDNRTRR